MSVLAEALSVIVTRAALERSYPGGVEQYRADCPNQTYCADSHLTRIGFMAPPDVAGFIEQLSRRGLVFFNGAQFVDIAVVDEFQGPTAPCPWLVVQRYAAGFTAVWHVAVDPNPMVCPAGWEPGRSKMTFVPNEEVETRLLQVAREGSVDIILDYSTGKQLYFGRTPSQNSSSSEVD